MFSCTSDQTLSSLEDRGFETSNAPASEATTAQPVHSQQTNQHEYHRVHTSATLKTATKSNISTDPDNSQNDNRDNTQSRPNLRDPVKLYYHFYGLGKGHSTKLCACFVKGKEYQEAQQATALGPPKPINYTRRQPTPQPPHTNTHQ